MEKPGQRPPHPEIISRDEVKSPLRRFIEHFITVVCWTIYLYLLLPLFTLVLWVFGIQTIYDQIIGEGGYEALIHFLKNGGITTLVILAVTLGWAQYNYIQFKRRGERRMSRMLLSSDAEISRGLGIDITDMEEIRSAYRLEVHVEGDGYRIAERE